MFQTTTQEPLSAYIYIYIYIYLYILSGAFIHFPLLLNPVIQRMNGKHTQYSVLQIQGTRLISPLFYNLFQAVQSNSRLN